VLGKGNVLRVPVTQGGEETVLLALIDEVTTGATGAECHLSVGRGGMWVPAALLLGAIERAEITVDPGIPPAATVAHLPY
jgi:hypothetical protein